MLKYKQKQQKNKFVDDKSTFDFNFNCIHQIV